MLTEFMQIVSAFVPVDMQAAANNGDWVSLKNYGRVAVVLFKAAGTAGDDPIFTLRQATAVDGSGAKALNFTRIDSKVGTLTAVGTFTKNTQTAANIYTDTVSAEAQAIMVVDIGPEHLDVANGFDCVQLQIPDVGGNAQLGCGFYILYDPRYAGQASALPSAIVD